MHGTGSGGRIIITASWLGRFSVFLARFAPSPVLLLIERVRFITWRGKPHIHKLFSGILSNADTSWHSKRHFGGLEE